MKILSRILTSFLAIGAFAVVVGFSGPAPAESQSQSQCAAFPKVAWWGKISHERVILYVNQKYGGDWKRYITKWKLQLKSMVDIYYRNSTAIIKKDKIKLSGDKLEKYIISVVERISVIRCLAGEESDKTRRTSSTSIPGRG